MSVKTNWVDGKPIEESEEEKRALSVSSPREYSVKLVERKEVRDFIEKWHYSHNINGLQSSFCFGLFYGSTMIGAMIYGKLGMAGVWKAYAESPDDVVELRRLAMIDSTVRNAESFFIGQTLRWLKKNTKIKVVVSYADSFYSHEGTIYKATNFDLIGKTAKGKLIRYNEKLYHDKTIRTKYKGELKPFARKIKDAIANGEASYVETPPKNIYLKKLR